MTHVEVPAELRARARVSVRVLTMSVIRPNTISSGGAVALALGIQ